MGGVGKDGPLASCEKLNLETGQWEQMAPMSGPRYGHVGWISQGKIFVAGGRSSLPPELQQKEDKAAEKDHFNLGEENAPIQDQAQPEPQAPPTPLDTIEVYDIASNSWTTHGKPRDLNALEKPLTNALYESSWFNIGNELLIIGGTDANNQACNKIYKLNKEDYQGLVDCETMKVGRATPFAIRVQDKIFIIGGTKQRVIDAFFIENLRRVPYVSEVEKALFFQLENYLDDLSLSACSFG